MTSVPLHQYWNSTQIPQKLHVGTGTSKCGTSTSLFGTGTTASLHVGTGTIMCGTGTTASANAPPHRSITRGFSTAAAINRNDLHLFSRHEPLQQVCTELEKLAQAQNERDNQRHIFLHKIGAKHELWVLKSYINVALLCIQHPPNLQLASS